MSDLIYLDHNATTPILAEVAEAIRDVSLRVVGNPSSQHQSGQQARRVLEDARRRIAELLGARTAGMNADRVIFTSGGTEANNLALFGLLAAQPHLSSRSSGGHLVTSAIEHPAVSEPANQLERQGWQVDRVKPDTTGVVSPADVEAALRPETRLVSLMAANNETGVLQPIDEVAQLCSRHQVPLHTDAAQWVGKLPVEFAEWNLAALSCAAHKFHGPCGLGILILRSDVPLRPTLFGGHQQSGFRPGTELVALAVGAATALECWHRDAQRRALQIQQLRDQFEQNLLGEIPSAVVIGKDAPRLPNTSSIAFPDVDRQAMFLALDVAKVACSAGSACASGSTEPSPALEAMGLEKPLLEGTLRFSLGPTTTAAEITEASRRILNAYRHLQQFAKC